MMTTMMVKMNILMTISGLINLMATSRNWSELLWAWEEWRNVTGKKMKTLYATNVFLLNNLTGKYG